MSGEQRAATASGDLTPELRATSVWSDELVGRAGIPVVDAPLVSVGGGIGSFVLLDVLRIAGLAPEQVRVLTPMREPWQAYEYLTRVSQIPRGERLRSDSASCPDNLWGWPSYALREAWDERTLAPLWNVATEPILTDYWTPKAGQVFETMAREAERIGYDQVVVSGQVRMVRRRLGGGYFSVLTPPLGTTPTRRVAYRSRFVHLAVGYPGLRLLPDLQAYRERTGDRVRVVNAYEPHEHVYEACRRRPCLVLVRGSGIVASRVLQRLIDDRDAYGLDTQVLHLFRTYVEGPHGSSWFMRRRGGHGFAHQGFNWPKGAWGGQLKERLETLEGDDRKAFIQSMGGTNTPRRKLWQRQLGRGRQEGWYRTFVGEVAEVDPGPDQTVVSRVRAGDGSVLEVPASFIIDCTGLEADLAEHPVLADLLEHGGAGRNPVGRLDVTKTFEVRGTEAPPGRLYATGAATLGGYYVGVDSFLGLQYAAIQIADDLARQRMVGRIGVGRSVREWWRWVRGVAPS